MKAVYLVGQKIQVDCGSRGLDLGTRDLCIWIKCMKKVSILKQKNLHLSNFFSTTSRSRPIACLVMRSISAMHCNVSETYDNVSLNKEKKTTSIEICCTILPNLFHHPQDSG